MQGGQSADRRRERRGTTLWATLATGLVAAALSLGIGLAVLGALAATATVAAGGLGMAYGACQSIEDNLAADLNVSVAALQAIDQAALPERVAARQALGLLTASGAQRANERVEAYGKRRQIFASPGVPAERE